jgi:hypothetical protein
MCTLPGLRHEKAEKCLENNQPHYYDQITEMMSISTDQVQTVVDCFKKRLNDHRDNQRINHIWGIKF